MAAAKSRHARKIFLKFILKVFIMKDFSCSHTLRFNLSLESLGYNKTALLLKSVAVVLACFMIGCAHTEKYLHPEKTFSLDNLSVPEDDSRQLMGLPVYETCADKTSIHSPVIWVPLFGPAIDFSTSSKIEVQLPVVGTMPSFSCQSLVLLSRFLTHHQKIALIKLLNRSIKGLTLSIPTRLSHLIL